MNNKLNSQQTASLTLRTIDLNNTNNPNGDRGSINTGKYQMTWNNIDLKLLLGPMFEDYDLFNLCLRTVSSGSIAGTYIDGTGNNLQSNNIILNISGLPFINQTYDVYNGIKSSAVLGTYQIAGSTYSNQAYYDNRSLCFSKQQQMCNITINYTRVYDNGTPNVTSNNYADTVFMFEIIGIPKEKGNENGTRMFKN